ncbi:MAG TPA: hypothetical protein VED37_07955 [Ktedonobacteraceae bacterium]|nr:hypothetical protein [Ktedonobacteraceae bacterium]
MTLPTPDAQSPSFLSQQTNLTHSTPMKPSFPSTPIPSPVESPSIDPLASETETSTKIAHERAMDFATRSWDLATGGLKTLTAKRELPPRRERRSNEHRSNASVTPRSSMFPLIILVCIVIMLLSGGIVLFMMVQP